MVLKKAVNLKINPWKKREIFPVLKEELPKTSFFESRRDKNKKTSPFRKIFLLNGIIEEIIRS